ncbi:TonB-dependent receptor family protein [Methylophilus sp. 3sh_L]|uniref:TonB-dependent receptor family protein n=1 Tax=Methylophilus sp. 3sh_L TaxID=3377114 RepID=UPI00398E9E01
MRTFRLSPLTIAIATVFTTPLNGLADEGNTVTLSPIVVTATRQAQNSFDLPVAIDVVEQKNIKDGQLQINLSESLIRVPGITAQNRTQQAQDPQISSRGFGARSSFGVRGIRIYVDGIPLTMPDGQGQPGVVDLSAIKSIEVMRGPFSSLYGNSSGGVIQMFTQDAPATPTIGATSMFGSYDTKRNVLEAAGQLEGMEYMLNVSNFESDGYREHSRSNKQMATAKFKFNLTEDTKITTLINWFDQDAQDPGGLTKADVASDRKGVVPATLNANTRVSRSHTQVGFNFEHTINPNNTINLITYVGTRENNQILATNATGSNARSSQISREFYGSDLRWDNRGEVAGKQYNISLGLNYGKSTDARKDTNIQGTGLGPNRIEDNIVDNFDQYLQGKLALTDNFDVHAGVRHTKVTLKVNDQLTPPDNSGSVDYQKTNPVLGATWKVTPALNLYANFGKGFETPTFIEAAYNSTAASATPNLTLKPSQSNNYEVGAKAYITDSSLLTLTAFRINTQDELVVSANSNGRSVYANANNTKRYGTEISLDTRYENNITTYFSYSFLNAKYSSSYVGNNGLIESGNYIPGTYRNQLYGEVAWKYQPLGFYTALEGRYNSKVYVDDINSQSAPSYTIFNLRAGLEQNLSHWNFKEYIRLENMFDREYIGAVRVNDTNARFYESAAGRNYLVGINAQYKF